jgi:serine/threonine protein kinase
MPQQWGDWKNLGQIGQVGLGRVFKVEHVSNGTQGALKQLISDARIQRLRNEVDAALRLKHKHIAALIDADLDNDKPFAVFEWVDGGSIGDLTSDELSSISLDQRLSWCEQICEALEHAHDQSVIHRDIKPDNVLLDNSRRFVKVCDFGLVYFSDGERVTATMEQAGSRYYIAPECEDGRAESITPATDFYSVGKLIYYVTSGGRMFARERHREPDRELATILGDPFAEHISSLLDKLIVGTPAARVERAHRLRDMILVTRRRLSMKAPCKGKPETHICVFCREGHYQVAAVSQNGGGAHNLEYTEGNIGKEQFIFIECPACGNCQRFKFKHGAGHWFATPEEGVDAVLRVRTPGLNLLPDGSR